MRPHERWLPVLARSRNAATRVRSATTVAIAGAEHVALHVAPGGRRTYSPSTTIYFGAHVSVLPSSERIDDRFQANTGHEIRSNFKTARGRTIRTGLRPIPRSRSPIFANPIVRSSIRGSSLNTHRDFVPTHASRPGASRGSPAEYRRSSTFVGRETCPARPESVPKASEFAGTRDTLGQLLSPTACS